MSISPYLFIQKLPELFSCCCITLVAGNNCYCNGERAAAGKASGRSVNIRGSGCSNCKRRYLSLACCRSCTCHTGIDKFVVIFVCIKGKCSAKNADNGDCREH